MAIGGLRVKVHIIDADDFAAMNVNDLLIQQIALQQEKSFALHGRPIGGGGIRADAAIQGRNPRKWQLTVALLGANDESGDMGEVISGSNSNFAHTSAFDA